MVRAPLPARFDAWVETLDQKFFHESTSTRIWIGNTLFFYLVLPLSAWAPALKDLFALRLLPCLIIYTPLGAVGIVHGLWHSGKKSFNRTSWIAILCGSIYFQFFCASLIVCSGSKGAMIFSSLLLLVTAYHGHNWRVTTRQPLFLMGTALAVASAWAICPTREKLILLSFVGPTAILTELVLGTNARRWADEQRRAEQLKAAFSAQLLTHQSKEVSRLSEALVEIFGRNHDLNNALMATNLHAEIMLDRCRTIEDGDLRLAANELESSLSQMNHLVSSLVLEGRQLRSASLEEVEIQPIADSVRLQVEARFPSVQFELSLESGRLPKVLVRGGAPTLHRIIENLLINACEGNGSIRAKWIQLKIENEPSTSRMKLIFRDNGPGFSPEQLANNVQAFATSKPHGTGLGLYTSERLVMASGGLLIRENHPEGGAQIAVSLPISRERLSRQP